MKSYNTVTAPQGQPAAPGIKALQLSDGVAEWAAVGLPVKRSPTYKSLFASAIP
jgi:hypothetical protein